MFLRASTNNRACTVLSYFQEAVNLYNLPSRVCTGLGMENVEVAQYMLQARGLNRGSIITEHLFTIKELKGSGVK